MPSQKVTIDIVAKTNLDATLSKAKSQFRELDALETEAKSRGRMTLEQLDQVRSPRSRPGTPAPSAPPVEERRPRVLTPAELKAREMREDKFEQREARYDLENLLGKGFNKFMMVGAIVDMFGRQMAAGAEKAAEVWKEFEKGKLTTGEFFDKLAGGIPIVGGFWEAGRTIRQWFNPGERLQDLQRNIGVPKWMRDPLNLFGDKSAEDQKAAIAQAERDAEAGKRKMSQREELGKISEQETRELMSPVEKAKLALSDFESKAQKVRESSDNKQDSSGTITARAALQKAVQDAETKSQRQIEDNLSDMVDGTAKARDRFAAEVAKLQGDTLAATKIEAGRAYADTTKEIDRTLRDKLDALDKAGAPATSFLRTQLKEEADAQKEEAKKERDRAIEQAKIDQERHQKEQRRQLGLIAADNARVSRYRAEDRAAGDLRSDEPGDFSTARDRSYRMLQEDQRLGRGEQGRQRYLQRERDLAGARDQVYQMQRSRDEAESAFHRERRRDPTLTFQAEQVDAGSSAWSAYANDMQNMQSTTVKALEDIRTYLKERKEIDRKLVEVLAKIPTMFTEE